MAQHTQSKETQPHRWEPVFVPAGFEPEQALASLLKPVGPNAADDELFPSVIQLNGTREEFLEAFQTVVETQKADGLGELGDLFRSEIASEDLIGSPDYFAKRDIRDDFPDPDPSGERLDLILEGRFLRLMSQAYQVEGLRDLVDRIKSISVGVPLKRGSAALERNVRGIRWRASDAPEGSSPEGLAITAIIDEGIPVGHPMFKNGPSDTRIAHLWVQDGVHDPASDVPYGRELTKSVLDGYLAQSENGADEDQFYRLTGQADFSDLAPRNRLGFGATHGAHVGRIAAGYLEEDLASNEDAIDPANNPIIAVQLPKVAVSDTSGGSLAPYLRSGIKYIFQRADEIAREKGTSRIPLVINFSFGFLAAPHDGTHPIEKFLDQMVALRNAGNPAITEMVLPSGNSRELQCHAVVDKPQKEETLRWRVLPDDRTISYGVLYLPKESEERNFSPNDSRLEMRLESPDGVVTPSLREQPNFGYVLLNTRNQVLAVLYYQNVNVSLVDGSRVSRGQYFFGVQQTENYGSQGAFAPAGDWKVHVKKTENLPECSALDAYIQRDDTSGGYSLGGRQSYFNDPEYRRFKPTGFRETEDRAEAYCKRDGTMNGIATGFHTIRVAGLIERTAPNLPGKSPEAAPYSSGGPEGAFEENQNPDVSAISDVSIVQWGRRTAGSRSGSHYRVSGTSIAAPLVARGIAKEMMNGTWQGKAGIVTWPRVVMADVAAEALEPKRVGSFGGISDRFSEDILTG